MRDLCVKVDVMTMIPYIGTEYPAYAANVEVLMAIGVVGHLLGDFTAGRMDDVLASKVWPAANLINAGQTLHDAMGLVDAGDPGPDGLTGLAFAEHLKAEQEDDESLREICAAYWLHVAWVGLCQTMH
jgi:hypothetical protein